MFRMAYLTNLALSSSGVGGTSVAVVVSVATVAAATELSRDGSLIIFSWGEILIELKLTLSYRIDSQLLVTCSHEVLRIDINSHFDDIGTLGSQLLPIG
jgi:hypothetical protein